MAQTGAYATTTLAHSASLSLSATAASWESNTFHSSPDSRCSRVSPMHTIAFRPWCRAYSVFSATCQEVLNVRWVV